MKTEEGCWDTQFLEQLLKAHPAKFGMITDNAERFRFQVLVSNVIHDHEGRPCLVRYGYRLDNEYFYPASAIKLCAAVAVSEKLRALQHSFGMKITYTTPLSIYPILEGDNAHEVDSTNAITNMTTVEHEIHKLFLVSDNAAFDRLYAIVGQGTLNQAMWSLGLQSTRIFHRLSIQLSTEQNKACEPIRLDLNGTPVVVPPKKSKLQIPDIVAPHGVHVGRAYIAENGKLITEPMDFSKKNCMSLLDLQNLLVKLVRNDIELHGKAIEIDEGFRTMLMMAMCQYPKNSCNLESLESKYPGDHGKFFLPGLSRVRPKGALRVYNKVGRAYGFSVDNAYVFDIETGHSFFLSAVIYTNANGILNDDIYEYEEVADRVMANLAEVVTRALRQIPGNSFVSTYYDCIPSSLWDTSNSQLFSVVPSTIYPETSQVLHIEDRVCLENEVPENVEDSNASMLQDHPKNLHCESAFGEEDIDIDTKVEVTFSKDLLEQKTANIDLEPRCSFSPVICLDIKHVYFIDE